MIEYPCGCANEIDAHSGIMRSETKCNFHVLHARDPSQLGAAYFRELAILDGLDGNMLVNTRHVDELEEALGEFPDAFGAKRALEIGTGCSPYVGSLLSRDWRYRGLDASEWAADWTARYWDVQTVVAFWEAYVPSQNFDLILSAHALEHMEDAPRSLAKMVKYLEPGGELWLVVPDDSDPVNPDHLWFFTEDTLASTIRISGLTLEKLVSRQVVPREKFLYAKARKLG